MGQVIHRGVPDKASPGDCQGRDDSDAPPAEQAGHGARVGTRVDNPERKPLPQGAQATSSLCLEQGGG